MNEDDPSRMPFHRYAGSADDPPWTLCPVCGVKKDRAIHDQQTADRHGGFQDIIEGDPDV